MMERPTNWTLASTPSKPRNRKTKTPCCTYKTIKYCGLDKKFTRPNQVSPRIRLQPSPINLDIRNQKRIFQIVYRTNSRGSRKQLPKSQETTMGHLDQTRNNKRSTKPTPDKRA